MKIIVANWKSNKNLMESLHWLDQALPTLMKSEHQIVLAPPFPFLASVASKIDGAHMDHVYLGVQDISPFPAGAYTGAVGVKNVEGLHVTHAIVGHSERRRYFHETDNDIANKVREALAAHITPIVCVTKDTLVSQANAIDKDYRGHVIVAFEPIEHIGTGTADTLEHILSVKALVREAFGKVPYMYGGSVDLTDRDLLTHAEIDGFLVGGASLSVSSFLDLVQTITA